MITLRNMNEEEFVNYRSLFIHEYSQDLQNNRGYLSEKARIKAIESIDTVLTKGVVTPANQLWCIQQPDEPQRTLLASSGCRSPGHQPG